MVIDYKDISFSFQQQKRRQILRRFRLAILLVLVVLFFLFYHDLKTNSRIKNIQDSLLKGDLVKSQAALQTGSSSLFRKNSFLELAALLALCQDDWPGAQSQFDHLKTGSTGIAREKFLADFSDKAQYRRLNIYLNFLAKKQKNLAYYQALSHLARLDERSANKILENIDPETARKRSKEIAIMEGLGKQIRKNRISYIFDRNGKPLAAFDVRQKKTIGLIPGFSFEPFHRVFQQGVRFFTLTMDSALQQKIDRIFKPFKGGSFILLDLQDGAILASFSKSTDPAIENPVFTERFEPGSIIKLITLYAFLENPVKNFYPFNCQGSLILNNHIFQDWARHNILNNPANALAVSCNTHFAQIGLQKGFPAISGALKHFLFNQQNLRDQFLSFRLGKFNDSIRRNYELACLSVGLDEISISTIHASLLSEIIATQGRMTAPYLIQSTKNLLNLSFQHHQASWETVLPESPSWQKLQNAMLAVTQSSEGTGRRAQIDVVQIGVKTGTTGGRPDGFNAIMTGFFPFKKPQYAFAFQLERAGKAELQGALTLKEFLLSFMGQEGADKK